MKLLKCKVCKNGEIEIIGQERSVSKKVKCLRCGFTNAPELDKKNTEVVIIRRPNRKP